MTADPRLGSPQEKSLEPKTLGQMLFPENASSDTEGSVFQANKFLNDRIRAANSIEAIEEALFVLKLDSYDTTVRSIVLETVFECLLRYRVQMDGQTESDSMAMMRAFRERLGKTALEVFFEGVFVKDKEVSFLEEHFSSPKNNCWSNGELYPRSICVLLDYFAKCTESTKKDHKSSIRKFLKHVLNESLIYNEDCESKAATISAWGNSARTTLATALVANGMYEECLEYSLSEAIQILTWKFLALSFTETEDGLVEIFHSPKNVITIEEAMTKACQDREWRHIWSVLTLMEYQYKMAHFIRTIDHDDPRTNRGTNAPLKLAFMFDHTLEGGLQGL